MRGKAYLHEDRGFTFCSVRILYEIAGKGIVVLYLRAVVW